MEVKRSKNGGVEGLGMRLASDRKVPNLTLTLTLEATFQYHPCSTRQKTKSFITKVSYHEPGVKRWTAIQAKPSDKKEYDLQYLEYCKNITFFRSANGEPKLHLVRNKVRFPTPIATSTRLGLKV